MYLGIDPIAYLTVPFAGTPVKFGNPVKLEPAKLDLSLYVWTAGSLAYEEGEARIAVYELEGLARSKVALDRVVLANNHKSPQAHLAFSVPFQGGLPQAVFEECISKELHDEEVPEGRSILTNREKFSHFVTLWIRAYSTLRACARYSLLSLGDDEQVIGLNDSLYDALLQRSLRLEAHSEEGYMTTSERDALQACRGSRGCTGYLELKEGSFRVTLDRHGLAIAMSRVPLEKAVHYFKWLAELV